MIREVIDFITRRRVHYRFRSAVTGRIVSAAFAAANPDTTVRERVK